ncbi:hypothetical protein AX14_006129 [Amanita brunnescens Koide BX004]|nr:hypothetical protein AX14_006129 [Amanita brunnescens Koide BX004]
MAPKTVGPPGLTRPKSTSSPSSPPSSGPPQIFSPAPSQPHSSWFKLLSSPAPSPVPFVPSAAVPPPTEYPSSLPHVSLMQTVPQSTAIIRNNDLITDLTSSGPTLPLSTNDPWTRAHTRVCTHASDECAACSISVVCCSCRALCYTPGPPPASPTLGASVPIRSRSVSPSLFRDIGNAPTPPGFHDGPDYDDEAYAHTCAECDTCDNSSCPRGHSEPASWSITVEQFDESSEEFFDRTFRACAMCNRSCKKTFMSYKIKARHFDNSSKVTAQSTKHHIKPRVSSPISTTPAPGVAQTSPVIPKVTTRPMMPIDTPANHHRFLNSYHHLPYLDTHTSAL